jgi:integrase
MVSWKPPGEKRKRKYFAAKLAADKERESIEMLNGEQGSYWLTLSALEREASAAILREIQDAGFSLRTVWEGFRHLGKTPTKSITLGEAYDTFIAEKKAIRLAPKSLLWYKSGVGQFVSERTKALVSSVTREEVTGWLSNPEWSPRTFNARRAGLQIFFGWCKGLKYLSENPVDSIERISERRMPDLDKAPAVLSLCQCGRLLKVTLESDPGLVPFVAVCLFAGLRPEREAGKLSRDDLRDGHIHVLGAHAKDRQRRHVPIHPILQAWLNLGGDFNPTNLRRRFEAVREAAGLIQREKVEGKARKQIVASGWVQDCLRHTFASHYLPVFGGEQTIKAMGHGDYDMLFGHYRAMVTPQDAAAFWMLTPKVVMWVDWLKEEAKSVGQEKERTCAK